MSKKVTVLLVSLFVAASSLMAQNKNHTVGLQTTIDSSKAKVKSDSTKFNEEAHRHELLTAGTFARPRDISIGIPVTDPGHFLIVENDLPVVYYNLPQGPQSVWRPDGSFSEIGLMNLHDALILYGFVGYGTSSYTQNGIRPVAPPPGSAPPGTLLPIQDKFQGVVNYNTDDYGLQEFDASVSSPIGKNWYFSLNTFQNFDPGYTKIPYHSLNDRLLIYRASLTKKFDQNRGDITAYYRYADTYSLIPVTGMSPFVYDGNGKISELNGIKWGTDYYGDANGSLQYVDIRNGQMHSTSLQDATDNHSQNVLLLLHYNFDNQMKLKTAFRWNYCPYAGVPIQAPISITDLSKPVPPGMPPNGSYSLPDGTPYTGLVQQWLSLYNQGRINDGMLMSEISKTSGKHNWKVGIDFDYHFAETWESSSFYNTSVAVNTQMLTETTPMGSGVFSGFNLAGGYYIGDEVNSALYAIDKWNILDNLRLWGGLRLDYLVVNGKDLPYNPAPGFYMGSTLTGQSYDGLGNTTYAPGTAANLVPFSRSYFLPSASFSATYNLLKDFGFLGDYSFAEQGYGLNYNVNLGGLGQQPPSVKAVSFEYGRAGVFYDNPLFDLVSAFTFMYSPKNMPFALNSIYNGQNVSLLQMYDIQTLGWTTDMLIRPWIQGATLHFLVQYFNPQYKNFTLKPAPNAPTFSYDGKIITGVPKLTLEIDPSYVPIPGVRLWASFRYYSRVYGSISNLIYFAPHWETFAGADWQVNKNLKLSFNVINLFNQLGITGMVPGSEFVTPDQTQQYLANIKGYMTAGGYLRPLAFNFSTQVTF